MNADGSNQTRLTNPLASYDRDPTWSPDGGTIAFARHRIFDVFSTESESEIYVMNADGSNQTILSGNSTDDYDPSWSPDGTKILFVRGYAIFVMSADGSNQTRLTDNRNWQPRWSPDGTRIVFSSERHGFPNYEIYVMNADGSNQTRLTNNTTRDIEPAWSPDGSLIAFARYQSPNDWNSEEIYVMNPDGSNQTRLTNNQAQDYAPAWSRDGARIVFTTNQVFNSQIYVVNLDGSGRQNLSNNAADDYDPVWSPGGDRIAFVSNRDGNFEIYVMDADGSNQRRLTNNPGEDSDPAWSPDGARIVYVSSQNNYKTICVMNADGSSQTRIGSPSYYIEPAWSPDGSKIAFTSSNSELFVMNADGSNTKQLTHNPNGFTSTNPAWSPDGTKIAFERGRDISDQLYPDEIYVINADGSNQANLTNNPTEIEASPAWTPDGKILFARDGLYVMNADGSNQTRLSDYTGDVYWGSSNSNSIDDLSVFVRQQYLDFLNREPDPDGLAFWTNEITSCGGDQRCTEARRTTTSAAFFLSIEFQETGYLVYRTYKASYDNYPGTPLPIKLDEFASDTKAIGQGVIVNQAGWQQILESNKEAFTKEFVQRSRFVSAYLPSMSAEQFVDALFSNAGVNPSASDRTAAINEFAFSATTADVAARARALRCVAENSTLAAQEFNRAFVLMQYFGYLRRNPNDAPNGNFDGYNFWLNKLNTFNGDFVQAEMVKAFITSGEYRQRFGP
jgi:Tol biopolymer transport system component